MKISVLLLTIASTSLTAFSQGTTNFHDYFGRDIEGANVNFSDYYGKKVMVVNTASFCAFTPQFEDLQDLYEQYNEFDFEIIGFPCNDFDNQDPGADSTILEFCTSEYGVTFKMMSKAIAVLPDTTPVFRWLQEAELNGVQDAPISWNFHKFLIDEAGDWVAHYSSFDSPTSSSITDWIMSPSALSVTNQSGNSAQLLQPISAIGSDVLEMKFLQQNSERTDVRLFTIDGREVDLLYSGVPTGGQTLRYDASALPAGIYLIQANTKALKHTLRYAVVK